MALCQRERRCPGWGGYRRACGRPSSGAPTTPVLSSRPG